MTGFRGVQGSEFLQSEGVQDSDRTSIFIWFEGTLPDLAALMPWCSKRRAAMSGDGLQGGQTVTVGPVT